MEFDIEQPLNTSSGPVEVLRQVFSWHGLPEPSFDPAAGPVKLFAVCQDAGLGPRMEKKGAFCAKWLRALRGKVRARRHQRELSPALVFGKSGVLYGLVPDPSQPGALRCYSGNGEDDGDLLDAAALKSLINRCHPQVVVVSPRGGDTDGEASGYEEETRAKEAGGHWFRSALWAARGELLTLLPASILINGFALAMPLFIMNVYDRVVPNSAIETLWVLATGVMVVFTFEFIIRLLRGVYVDTAGKRIDAVLADRIYGQTLALDMKSRPSSAGSFSSQARAYETVREFLSSATIVGLVDLPFALMMFGLIFWLAGPVGWIPVAASSAALLVILITQPFLRNLSGKSYEKMINRQSLFAETTNGLESVKAADAGEALSERMEEAVRESANIDLKTKRLTHFGTSFTAFCIHATTVGSIVGSVFQVSKGAMTMGAMIAVVMVVGRGMAPLNQVSNLLMRLQSTLAALRGLNVIMKLPREDSGLLLRKTINFPHFTLADTTFNYENQPMPSLNQVKLEIKPGERVGLIGKAGSGKTTLLRLLSRQCIADKGLVLVDGVDISQLHPRDIRRSIGYLPQDGTLFHGSVRDNVVLGERSGSGPRMVVDDDRLIRALTRAGVFEWTNKHPLGLSLPVGERGVLLSGGQRQSVLLARCLLTNPGALLLDEPTTSMDISAEKQFFKTIREWATENEDRTLILSTHKFDLLRLVDRVILIDDGLIKLDGPRDEVLNYLREMSNPAKKKTAVKPATASVAEATAADAEAEPKTESEK